MKKNNQKAKNNSKTAKTSSKTAKNKTKLKKSKFFSNFVIGGLTVLILSATASFALIFFDSNSNNQPVENHTKQENIVFDEKILNKNLKKEIQLICGEKTFNIDGNLGESLRTIEEQLFVPASNAEILFDPDEDEVFVFKEESFGQAVDINQLVKKIKRNIKTNSDMPISIPVFTLSPKIRKQDLEGLIELRSNFSTSIVTSPANRKHNVKYALSAFNGLVVAPDEIVSFNEIVKNNTSQSNFKDAKIIVSGDFVLGSGGGICQSSTTIYNALLLADVAVLEVHNHSLPVSYVPRAFDAMVSESYSDLVFQNTTGSPLYFLTSSDNETVTVKIFGKPHEDGLVIKTKTLHVKDLPHKGDKIVPDTAGKYSNKICFKGEYLRLRYPKAGSEDIGYLQYYKNGELIDEKEIRHVYYPSHEGIIVEGVDELYDGMTLPDNEVKFINSQ
ncbi:MAG: VanW family protein [Clostridia bacterium]|nr:VanW family protein [Clostridia bacterium]